MAERRRPDPGTGAGTPTATGGATDGTARTPRAGRLFAAYTVLRVATFVAVALVLHLLGFRGWALVFVAIVLSAAVSLVAFRSQRRQLAEAMELRATARSRSRRRPT